MIFCEVQSHDAYGTPPELFTVFFVVIRDVLRDCLGADWSAEFDAAWTTTLKGLDDYVNQAIAAMRPRRKRGERRQERPRCMFWSTACVCSSTWKAPS